MTWPWRYLITPALGVLIASSVATAQGRRESAVVVVSPAEGASVAQVENVEGRLNQGWGWPVVLAGDRIVWTPGVRRSDSASKPTGPPALLFVCEHRNS